MSNPLTGDFEAVLQVSGATVNRLLASMHQNAGTKPSLPGFPHGAWVRIGDPTPIGGMKGSILSQISVPRIDLIHGVSDRFWLEVSIRARYQADPGTVPVPEFIHGTIRAQYRIDKIDPSCRGWQKLAPDYIWVRAIGDTVSFTGTAEDDVNFSYVVGSGVDAATADARITRIARYLLTKQFEATPHYVSRRFRRGSMRSLNVGVNRSSVAVPIGLSGDPVSGNIASVNQDILEGSDVGIAVDKDYIIGKIQEQLDAVKASFGYSVQFHHRTYLDFGFLGDVDVVEITINYTVKLTSATAQWIGGMVPIPGVGIPGGLVAINLSGGAFTQKPIFNFGFDATQLLLISFDPSTEGFVASAFGKAVVNLTGTFASIVESRAKPRVQDEIAAAVQNAANGMSGELTLGARKDELIKQLKTMDDNSYAWFDQAVFTPDGVIVRGHISLSPRRPLVNTFKINAENNGYTAYESWIPGGRIDSFGWSWKWFNNAGDPGSETTTDRFVLRRPLASGTGRFGAMIGQRRSLPGLDGMGQTCLSVHGVTVDSVTGALVPVLATRKCKQFGFNVRLATVGRVFLIEWVPGPRDLIGPVAEVAVHEVSGPDAQGHGANTLVVRIGERWNREVAMSIRDGLANSRRRDAGLVVLVLFSDGTLIRSGSEWMSELNELARELEAPLLVNEDVRGSWSKALNMMSADGATGDTEWRLVSPTGGVTWANSGPIEAAELAVALDDYLFTSPVANPATMTYGLPPGTRISAGAFETDIIGQLSEIEDACPPLPFGRLGVETELTFVAKGLASSDAAVRKLASGASDADEKVHAIVFDGATQEEVNDLQQSLPEGVIAIPDPDGIVSRRFGVRVWPSRLAINGNGMVTEAGPDEHTNPNQEREGDPS